MSCCGMPRKSDEPEYAMPPALARMVSAWESGCPGIIRAVHEEIATGDWDRQEAGFVPPYEPSQAFGMALRVLRETLQANFVRQQHRHGPWYVRWGLANASTVLPPQDQQLLESATHEVAKALAACDAPDAGCQEAPLVPSPSSWPAWNNPQVSMTFQRIAPSQPGTVSK